MVDGVVLVIEMAVVVVGSLEAEVDFLIGGMIGFLMVRVVGGDATIARNGEAP